MDITCYSMIRNMKDRKEPLRSPREAFKWNYNYVCTQNDAVRTTKLMKEKESNLSLRYLGSTI